MKHFILFCLILCSSLKSWAGPECDYDFSLQSAALEVTDVQQVVPRQTTLNRQNGSSNGRCTNYRIYFSKGLGNSYQRKAYSLSGESINYNLHATANLAGILKDFGDAVSANEFVQGSAPNREQDYSNTFYVSVPSLSAQNSPAAGFYWDVVQVRIYGVNGSNFTYDETRNLYISLNVNKKIDISLVEEGGAFDANSTSRVMDFGILTQNQEKGVDLKIVTNASYQVRVSSLNNGSLKHQNNTKIAYALRVNGQGITLSNSAGSPVTIGSGDRTPAAGDTYNMKVKILSVTEDLTPGEYSDVITITAVAN